LRLSVIVEVESLKNRVPKLLRLGTDEAPKAIVLVTAHWLGKTPIISSNDHHDLYFDYYNFPPEAYKLKYEAPGSKAIAEEVYKAFTDAGLKAEKDAERGKSC
jgi:aromatic ring-opening dioxygenase catalytic subunit (LigB family)